MNFLVNYEFLWEQDMIRFFIIDNWNVFITNHTRPSVHIGYFFILYILEYQVTNAPKILALQAAFDHE